MSTSYRFLATDLTISKDLPFSALPRVQITAANLEKIRNLTPEELDLRVTALFDQGKVPFDQDARTRLLANYNILRSLLVFQKGRIAA